MSQVIPEKDHKIVDEFRERLLEHFDSVRIFVTRHSGEQDATGSYTTGGGHFYAQLGQVNEWMQIQLQQARNDAHRKDNEE